MHLTFVAALLAQSRRTASAPPSGGGGGGSTINAATASLSDVNAAITLVANGGTVQVPAGAANWSAYPPTQGKSFTLNGAGAGYCQGHSRSASSAATGNQTFVLDAGSVPVNLATAFVPGDAITAYFTGDRLTFRTGTVVSWTSGTLTLIINVTSFGTTGGPASAINTCWTFTQDGLTRITDTGTTGLINAQSAAGHGSMVISNFHFIRGGGTADMVTLGGTYGTNEPVLLHDVQLETNDVGNTTHALRLGNLGIAYNFYMRGQFKFAQSGNSLAVDNSGGIVFKNGPASSWTTGNTLGTNDTDGKHNAYIEDWYIAGISLQAWDFDDQCRAVIRHGCLDHSSATSHGADTSADGNRHAELDTIRFIYQKLASDGSLSANQPYGQYMRGGIFYVHNISNDALDSGGWWGTPTFFTMIVQNLRRNSGPYACWTGGYPAPHQVGFGYESGAQLSFPCHYWNNSIDSCGVSDYQPDDCGNGLTSATNIQSGRDFIHSVGATAAPAGFVSYVYPHDLRV